MIAIAITLYFFRKNLIGIHESSEKALKIMIATTIMAVIITAHMIRTAANSAGPQPIVAGMAMSAMDVIPDMSMAMCAV